MLRIIGVDPGLTRCGFGIIDADFSRKAKLVHVSVKRTSVTLAEHFRIKQISQYLEDLIEQHKPNVISCEKVFSQQNKMTVSGTMHVVGAVMLISANHSLAFAAYTPTEVKKAVTGNGKAVKSQVQYMICRILGLSKLPTPADAADALAVAITQAWRGTGILGLSSDNLVEVSPSGKISSQKKLTKAQAEWMYYQSQAQLKGIVKTNNI